MFTKHVSADNLNVHDILVNSIDSIGSVELIRMNIIALDTKCIMQIMQSICKLNEDTF